MSNISIVFGKKLVTIFLSIFLSWSQCSAQDNRQGVAEVPKRSLSESIDGVITGQLVTVAGNIFFQYFIANWHDQPLSERFSITVHERPSYIRGNQIRIECLNRTVFVAILPNSRGDLKGFAERAAAIAYQNASEAEVQRLLFRDTDLAPDEL